MYFYKGVNIIKKGSIIIIALIILSSNIITATDEDKKSESFNITGISSVILISIDDTTNAPLPIKPLVEVRKVNLTITYSYVAGGFFSKIFLQLLKNRKFNINLNILSKPDWCQAEFSTSSIPMIFNGEEQNVTATLEITLTDIAPAFLRGTIEISASTPAIKGRFGKFTLLKGFEQTHPIFVTPAYLALMTISPGSGFDYKLTPFNTTTIPIDITNNGNGITKVIVEIENVSDKWDVNITNSITLEPENSGTINLFVKTDNSYDKATIKLKFTPAYAEDTAIIGKSEYISLNIENDGSYVEKNTSTGTDLIYYIILPLIIVLFIILIFVVLYQKKK